MKNLVIVTAKVFGAESLDKNGKQAIILLPVAGKIPNRNVISGTIAEREGLEAGKSYLCTVRENEASKEFGRQFSFSKVAEASVMDIINSSATLGEAGVYDATAVAEAVEQA